MIKLQIIGNLAHDNNLFDSTCKQCGGIYFRAKTPICPKCNQPLVPITAKNGRAMMVSEGTIYPLATQDQKDAEAKARSKRRNSMEITYRFVILSFANAETGIVSEPRIHPYLARGRQIMIEINHNPVISWFKANDGSIKCEIRMGILPNSGDFIKLLGKKEAMRNLTLPEPTAQTVQSIPEPGINEKLLDMKAAIDKLIADQKQPQAEVNKEKEVEIPTEDPFDGMIIDEANEETSDPF